jgi:hypothetical protein
MTDYLALLSVIACFCLVQFVPLQDSSVPFRDGDSSEQSAKSKKPSQLSLEELTTIQVDTVYGASKYEQNVTEASSAVSIVTADEIKKQGYRTLGDSLCSVRGFYVLTIASTTSSRFAV